MKVRTIVQIVLAVVILGLGYLLFQNFMTDIKFDNEFNARKEACAQRLKVIRTLEEAYKQTYGVYCGDFDTLINRLMTEDSLLVIKEDYDTNAIMKAVDNGVLLKDFKGDKTFAEALKEVQMMSSDSARIKKFVIDTISYGKALDELRRNKSNKDLMVKDAKTGLERPITDEEIRNCRYVPGKGKQEFNLVVREKEGVWMFLSFINFTDKNKNGEKVGLYDDLDESLLKNLIAERNNKTKELMAKDSTKNEPVYNSWRVGDTLKPETRGNFE